MAAAASAAKIDAVPAQVIDDLMTHFYAGYGLKYDAAAAPSAPTVQQILCAEMRETCDSEHDPILFEDWCDIPFGEYIKGDKYLSKCHRLSSILASMETNLTVKKNELYFPLWPVDPITGSALPVAKILDLVDQATEAKLTLPPILKIFVSKLRGDGIHGAAATINVAQGMKGPYIDGDRTGAIRPDYITKFVQPMRNLLFTGAELAQERAALAAQDATFAQTFA